MRSPRRWLAVALGLTAVGVIPTWTGSIASSAQGTLGADTEPAPVVAGHRLSHRWLLLQNNFQASGNVERVLPILDRAKAAGYNGALLADVKFGRLDDGSLVPGYYANLRTVLDHAAALGMQVRPCTADFGYSESILWHDPNLAEALPVREAPFRVTSGRLEPLDDGTARIRNGDFEEMPASGDTFPGWAWQDQPGITTFVDRTEKHGGRASLRMTDIGPTNPPHGHGRIHQRLTVKPFLNYHASVWVKTRDFEGGEVRLLVLGQEPSRTLQWNDVPVQRTRDWTRFDVTFNSLTHGQVLFYLGVWGGGAGTIWWDDAAVEPAGFVNVIRRPGAPVRLTNAGGTMALEEGRDVTPVVDPAVGRAPWPGSYDLWHQPPAVAALPGGALRDGDVVLASYYHAVTIYGSQVTASLTEPAVYDVVRGQLESTRREFAAAAAFAGWMLDYDEIRVHGWDESPRFGAGTPGDDLAQSVRAVHDMARALDPSADLYTWSDMFDPHHNAAQRAEPYYLVNGGWAGSWEGLPVDVGVINWNHDPEHRRDSARFFAERGHRQLLAGYYDTPPERFDDRAWLSDLEGIPGIDGVVYCQWGTGYGQLEAWATHVWGDAQWVPGPEPEATATATGSSQPNPTTAPTSATAASSVTPAASVTHTPRAAPSHRACLPVGWR